MIEMGERIEARGDAMVELGERMLAMGELVMERSVTIADRAKEVSDRGAEVVAALPMLQRAVSIAEPMEGAVERRGRSARPAPGRSHRAQPM